MSDDNFSKILFEIHSSVGKIEQKLTDHLERSEEIHNDLKSRLTYIDRRTTEMERMKDKILTFKWPAVVLLGTIFTDVGAGLWRTIKTIFIHVPPNAGN